MSHTIDAVTTIAEAPPEAKTTATRYRHSLWLLTKRDLKVRYTTNALGWVWSILDPLLMAGIYYFVFVVIFHRGDKAGEDPYIVFLLAALLPWTWFNGAVSDCTKVFSKEAKLIRSTSIPRSIWVNRSVLSKGIEFLLSIPVIAAFALIFHAPIHIEILLLPLALAIQAVLTVGVGLIVAPLVVFFKDLERAIRLLLRLGFYASPIVYSATDVPEGLNRVTALNPLAGIFGIYRSVFFPQELNWTLVASAAIGSVIILVIGMIVFTRTERAVLKEI
jgi:ABC-2 type transport system permease protein